jgi:C-terminal processing protease CtpA/Prc
LILKRLSLIVLLVFAILALSSAALAQEGELAPAEIVHDEGGPVLLRGSVTYTNILFTEGVSEPLIILEDEAGFIDRNEAFLFPPESQTLGQITSDFYTSPFTYSLPLPIEPQGSLRDVDHDGETDTGVMVFAVAYWNNVFGDSLIQERDQYGGGWSNAYASTRVSQDLDTENEIIGGKFLVYAPDDRQGFPSGFGEDGLLFTDDDPLVLLPPGYTVVDMDTDPFTFDRARDQVIDLIEPEGAALEDFSDMSYLDAFDAMIEMMRVEYAFTDQKHVDWDALVEEFRPRFEEATKNESASDYLFALLDFFQAIPDGHHGVPLIGPLAEQFSYETDGGLGMSLVELDDGRIIVDYLLSGAPAEQAGIEMRAEILGINNDPIEAALQATKPWSMPFSSDHVLRLQQLRYAIRFPVGTEVSITFKNPGESDPQVVTMTTVPERDSFAFSSFNVGLSGIELPIEYDILPSGYGYVKIYTFDDDDRFEVLLWERMIRTMKDSGVPGLIVDMRQNFGGSGFLADQMAAYFFSESLELGNSGTYDDRRGEFYFDPRYVDHFFVPSKELQYLGEIAVLIGPNCNSACEFFTHDMTMEDRSAIVGEYPTAGLGGGQKRFLMPEVGMLQFSASRNVDMDGNIVIEGKGVPPTVQVPVTEETVFSTGDPILEAAVAYLDEATAVEVVEGAAVAIGETISGTLETQTQVSHALPVKEGDYIDIVLSTDDDQFDPVLLLYTDDGTLVARVDETGTGESEIIPELEIPFDLTLLVEVGGIQSAGSYTLTVIDRNAVQPDGESDTSSGQDG